jgi:aspartate racemase
MKTLGLIGGIGPESTIVYYRLIIAAYQEQIRDGSYPPLILNSINLTKLLDLIGANELEAVTAYLLEEVSKLARAGADFGLLAANSPHIVFDDLRQRSPIPLLSIVDATRDAVQALGLNRVGLREAGARFTMQGEFYLRVFSQAGITLVTPSETEQADIHDKYMNELVKGAFRPETRARLLAIVDRLKAEEGIQGLILGGTELPLILKDDSYQGLPFFDTTKIHVQRAVTQMLA